MIRHLIPSLVLLLLCGVAHAQTQTQTMRLYAGASYQEYSEGDTTLTQSSLPLDLSLNLGRSRKLGMQLRLNPVAIDGEVIEATESIGDAQLGMNYTWTLGPGQMVTSLGVNIPSGTRELSSEVFVSTVLLNRHYYNFNVSSLGQGLNLAPGFVWAVPVSKGVVVGVGAAYQYKGPYKPLEDLTETFDPGDEVLVTGGLDLRLSTTVSLSTDVSYTHYLEDALGGEKVFQSGSRLTFLGQLAGRSDRQEWRVYVRYRSQSKSSLPGDLSQNTEELRVIPDMGWAAFSYQYRLSDTFGLTLLGQGRRFNETTVFEGKTVFDVGLMPYINLSNHLALQTRFVYSLGDITGFEAQGGLALTY